MDFIVDKFTLLGLNEREIKVFTALATFGRMNMTKIASRSQLPRTTVDAIVRRLLKQGLISEEKVRGHLEYVMNPEDVANKLDWVEKRLRPKNKDNLVKNDDKNVISKAGFETIERELFQHAGERVKLLFSHEYGDVYLCVDRLVQYIRLSVKAGSKLEILLSIATADALRGKGGDILIPQDKNAVRLNVVPASYGTVSTDMFIFRDVLLLGSPTTGVVEKIQHREIVEASKHLLNVACETGWSVNLVAWFDERR